MVRIRKQLICGVGKRDGLPTHDQNGNKIKSYQVWQNMLSRCYSDKYQKRRPTYRGCSVEEDWLSYKNFKKWFEENYIEGMVLDKDLLVNGNKKYSKETCAFIPNSLNNLFQRCEEKTKLGYYYSKKDKRFISQIKKQNKKYVIGYFKSEEEAEKSYKKEKKKYCTIELNKYLTNGQIKRNIYLSSIRKVALI